MVLSPVLPLLAAFLRALFTALATASLLVVFLVFRVSISRLLELAIATSQLFAQCSHSRDLFLLGLRLRLKVEINGCHAPR